MFPNYLKIFTLIVLIVGCTRLSAEEIEVQNCVTDRVPMGSELWESLQIFEDYLISANYLNDNSIDSYQYYFDSKIVLSAAEIAPNVRDFWELRAPISTTAFSYCLYQRQEESSFINTSSYLEFLNGYEDGNWVRVLSEIPASDFKKMAYRGAIILEIIRQMDS